MIEVKNVEKSFGDSKILKGVSTVFETGKTNLIIGQSGSGKTVLLKSLLGIHSPEVGTISFDGRIYSDLTPDELRVRLNLARAYITIEDFSAAKKSLEEIVRIGTSIDPEIVVEAKGMLVEISNSNS